MRFIEPNLSSDRVPAGAARRDCFSLERRAAGKSAPLSGAAQRTLAGEHRSGIGLLSGRAVSVGTRSLVIPVGGLRAESGRFAEGGFDPITP
jgi:hypothetical protein